VGRTRANFNAVVSGGTTLYRRADCFVRGKLPPQAPWRSDPRFCALYDEIKERTIVDRRRCYMLWQCARRACLVEGAAAELGVYRGGTARLLAHVFAGAKKPLHLFDTFEGMPEVDTLRDRHNQGDFRRTSLASVNAFLADVAGVRVHPGLFPETTRDLRSEKFAFAHIDADIYDSVFAACEFFYPRLSLGGVAVFDDYGFATCPGAKRAVDEFFSRIPEQPLYLPTGQCLVIKLGAPSTRTAAQAGIATR
jgi:O-methyltransferase